MATEDSDAFIVVTSPPRFRIFDYRATFFLELEYYDILCYYSPVRIAFHLTGGLHKEI